MDVRNPRPDQFIFSGPPLPQNVNYGVNGTWRKWCVKVPLQTGLPYVAYFDSPVLAAEDAFRVRQKLGLPHEEPTVFDLLCLLGIEPLTLEEYLERVHA